MEMLSLDGVFNRLLKVDTAYHSHHMQKVADTYLRCLGEIEHQNTKIPFFSSVSTKTKVPDLGADYWIRNLVSPVRFSDALIEATKSDIFANSLSVLEIGPHSALLGPI